MKNLKEKMNDKDYILNKITSIYIAIMIILFPLCVDSTGFFKILECKYRCFLLLSTTYIGLIIIALFYFSLFKKIKCFENVKLSKIQLSVIVFWFINLISCFLSPYFHKYNLFVGVGRGEGLITISLYCFIFLFITLFGKFEKKYILYFSISSILMNLIAILQYIGFNPFNMYQDGIGTHNVSFMATIGNIDFLCTILCMFLTISFVGFVFIDENKIENIIHLISMFMGFFIFEIIDVRIGVVAFGVTFAILFPFIITNSKRLSNTLIVFALILLGYCINLIINPVYYYNIEKLVLDFQFNYLALIFLVIIAIMLVLSYILRKRNFDESKNIKIIRLLYGTMIVGIILIMGVLFFVDFNSITLHEIHEILHGNFDENFGTYRLFLWKRVPKIYMDYPILGTGPDTFAVRFMNEYTQDVSRIGELTINDTAANVYLTMLVNIGLLGLISYIIFIVLQIVNGIKNKNKYSLVFLATIICLLVQDFFNLWVVIVTPLFWIIMGIEYISLNNETENFKQEKF